MFKAKRGLAVVVLLSLGGVALWLNRDQLPLPRSREDTFQFPDDPQDVLLLASYEPHTEGSPAKGGILIREIFRQALLIAGRDGLGLPTRDVVLREPFPASSSPSKRIEVSIQETAIPGGDLTLRITRTLGVHTEETWKKVIKIGGRRDVDYAALVELAEELSRTEFIDVLKSMNFRAGGEKKEMAQKRLVSIEERLRQMTFTEQFAALRELAAAMRTKGETESLLGGLVRAYANLSKLTESHWYASSKVFKARSLLYAQRLIHKAPESASSYWHRAYARSLSGFPAAGLEDLKEAALRKDSSAGTTAEGEAEPGWVRLIDLYARYRTEDLIQAGRGNDADAQLALLLATLTRENSHSRSLLLEAGDTLLAKNPECYHVIDLICHYAELGTLHEMTMLGFDVLTDTLPDRLRGMRALPEEVRVLLPVARSGRGGSSAGYSLLDHLSGIAALRSMRSDWEPRRRKIPEIAKALVVAGAVERDDVEPSWGVLGRMIQETIFKQMHARGHFLRYSLSVPTDEFVSWALPFVNDHPYKALIASYAIDIKRNQDAYTEVFKDVQVVDSELNMRRLLAGAMWHAETNDDMPGRRGWRFSWKHADRIDRDLHLKIKSFDDSSKPRLARSLLEISPYAPTAMATLIKHDWSFAEPSVGKWLEMHPRDPWILSVLAWHYTEAGDFEKANIYLRKRIEISPDFWAFRTLANNYYVQEDYENWKKVLEMQLQAPAAGLEHARAQDWIARFHISRNEFESARPYADEAAQTWAAWAMKTAARCYEGLGDWEKADLWWRRTAERYENHTPEWYFWCKRTGKGSTAIAEKLAEEYVKSVTKSSEQNRLEEAGIFFLLRDQPAKAIKMFRASFEKTWSPFAGLHLALTVLEQENAEACAAVLEQIVAHEEEYLASGPPQSQSIRLVRVLRKNMEDDETPLDVEVANRIIAGAVGRERANLNYFAGQFLVIQENMDAATECMHAATFEANETSWNHILARDFLHRHNAGDAWEAVRRARILMTKEKWEEALSRIRPELERGNLWVRICAAQCYEGLEKWDQAEAFMREVSKQDLERRGYWYFWCKRTGRGDVDASLQFAEEHARRLEKDPSHVDLEWLGVFYQLRGDDRASLKSFQQAFEQTYSPDDGLHAALLAEQLGDRKLRDELLRTISVHGMNYTIHGKPLVETIELAELFSSGLTENGIAKFDLERAKRISGKVRSWYKIDLLYFIGKMLSLCKRKEEATRYYERCAKDEMFNNWSLLLACDALRRNGNQVALTKPWTFP